ISCFECLEGYYCPKGIFHYSGYPCPAGYYCPNGTQYENQFPCPRGSYRPNTNGIDLEDCTVCDPGKYCQFEGNTTVTDDCDPGYFCVQGSWTPQPNDFNNYTEGDCLCPSITTGGRCQPGYYCPKGSSEPQECTEGNYCGVDGLDAVSAQCWAGYYCDRTATRPDPTDGVTGDICPAGRYCGVGTGANPPSCPIGTFSNNTQLTAVYECENCTAGYYCEIPGLTQPTGQCQAGYYCPIGQSIMNPFPCEAGYYCEDGSPDQVECPSGTYQDETTQSSCKVCNEGYYCNVADAPISDYTLYPCPIGYYCPNGTEYSTQYGCPEGTFGNQTLLEREDQCYDCPAGKYCDEVGLSNYKGDCAAGSWCKGKSATATPTDGVTGEDCPPGQYCPSGVPLPEDCPVGKMSDSTGLKMVSECQPCQGGYFCNGTGLTQPSGPCDPGYYCLGNATSPTPEDGGVTGDPCLAGHYCPGPTTSSIPCEPGTYTTTTHRSECDVCPEGSYCITGYDPEPCPHGFYCPNGTGYDWRPCPTGSYSNQVGLKNESQCTLCDPKKFCAYINATMVTGDCDAGYFCTEGSDTATPEITFKGVAGVCPVGSYCEAATDTPTPCARGTFGNQTKLQAQSDCTYCLYGMYCDAEGLTWPAGDCDPGFYCLRGSLDPNNPTEDATGGPCPAGHYCPMGTSFPLGCDAGTYNPLEGQYECQDCEEGFWCPENSTTASLLCPKGHYCPSGTKYPTQYPCPKGYYNDYQRKKQLEDCKPCEPGYYCGSPGQENVTELCAPGWYCIRGAWSDMPTDYGYDNISTNCFCPGNSTGGQCQPGEYCPEGSNYPTPCTRGYYCDSAGQQNETALCDEGYYCVEGAWRPDPNDNITGALCTPGHYCPRGTYDPEPCPSGYFSNATGNTAFEDCKLCSKGFYCEDSGLSEPTAPCEAGFFCPDGQNVSRPALYECSPGHYCPGQSSDEVACESGTYQDEWGMSSCKLCPEGYYCDGTLQNDTQCSHGVQNPVPCPAGHYCLNGTKYDTEHPCPSGTYNDGLKLKASGECIQCPGGEYCETEGLESPTGPCQAGFYCVRGAILKTPVNGVTGGICPVGAYCPTGTNRTYDCPPGTYNPTEGRESVSQCKGCEPGEFCPEYGMNQTAGDCTEGFYCTGNASVAAPVDGITGDICPIGFHCPAGTSSPVPCDPGTYTDTEQNALCDLCTPGHYCTMGTNPQDCPEGFYCPEGTGHVWQSCPLGTFSNQTGLSNETQCTQCTFGFYCDQLNATSESGLCAAGHYCRLGSDSRTPSVLSRGDAGICPPGYFCKQGTGEPEACPVSTFNNETNRERMDQCQTCLEGHYCDIPGLDYPAGECEAGYYCKLGSNSSNPSTTTESGGPCPTGSFCIPGSSDHTLCLPGYYNPVDKQSECLDCPEGYYCTSGSVMFEDCPKGRLVLKLG
ncbi:uncharacterized protein, partial [Asterias amurensis]|uniref:uncharacterized protein n=1 Tax=Asterias amurensis TaxID=7602 RepID=UPI003AB47176